MNQIPVIGRTYSLLFSVRGRSDRKRIANVDKARRSLGRAINSQRLKLWAGDADR